MSKRHPISDVLRKAVEASGLSRREVARRAGVPHNTLHRFVVLRTGVSMESADALARVLGLRLVSEQTKPKRKG